MSVQLQLSNDDSCAVDLILDRDAANEGINSCFSMDASQKLQERISRVETPTEIFRDEVDLAGEERDLIHLRGKRLTSL